MGEARVGRLGRVGWGRVGWGRVSGDGGSVGMGVVWGWCGVGGSVFG